MAGMLLAAMLAAMVAVADQVIDTWADGHLLVVWVALWATAFGIMSMLIPPLRQLSAILVAQWQRWSARRAASRAEEDMWQLAQRDYRLMDELRAARSRAQQEVVY
jgi:hypothetical protein